MMRPGIISGGLYAQYLNVAGAGNGGPGAATSFSGNGAGAGGVRTGFLTFVAATTITVGAQGADSTIGSAVHCTSGGNGAAGSSTPGPGSNGGSGGGAFTGQAAGTGVAGEGFAGGSGNGGGGGGAGGVGTGANTGGPGLTSSISGIPVTYGAGGPANNPTAGANPGDGGGGGNVNTAGGNGHDGIIIISYFGPQRATGGVITSVGGFTIHTFSAGVSTFTPS